MSKTELQDGDVNYPHHTTIQSNTPNQKRITTAPIHHSNTKSSTHSHEGYNHYKQKRMISLNRFSTLSALSGIQSPKTPKSAKSNSCASTKTTVNASRGKDENRRIKRRNSTNPSSYN